MSYTSPSPANIALNGNLTTWWIPATNLGSLTATGVTVTIVAAPSNGLQLETWSTDTGSFNSTTKIWSIGNLAAGQTKWLRLVTKVIDIGLAPFTMTSVITGNGIDPNNVNNTLVQNLTSVVTAVTAGAVADESCACGDVSLNDTACNYGVTEYRLTNPVVTNSTVYNWDETTGKYKFIHDNPFLDITTSYSIWCDPGTGFVQTSGPVNLVISKLFDDASIWDHTISEVTYAQLSVDDIAVLEAQHPGLDLTLSCWILIKNSEGDTTSGIPHPCGETRVFYVCTAEACIAGDEDCPCSNDIPAGIEAELPVGYVPQDGDIVFVQHPESNSVWKYVVDAWVRDSCGCIYKISQDSGNLITLGTDNAPFISADDILDATDEKVKVSVNDTTSGFLLGKLVAGDGIILTETNDGANETLVITSTATPTLAVEVLDSCSINMGITGDGTVLDPFVISAAYLDGGPTPLYASGTPGSTGNTLNVSTLFDMPCAGGCTATYELNGYSADVYDNVTLVGVTLTYNILDTAPSGTHYINIQRTCA